MRSLHRVDKDDSSSTSTSMSMSTLTSSLILSSFGLASKAFLRWGCKEVKVEGLHNLVNALEEPARGPASGSTAMETREKGTGGNEIDAELGRRGVVTICNHTSVVDDPMVSNIVPQSASFALNIRVAHRQTSKQS